MKRLLCIIPVIMFFAAISILAQNKEDYSNDPGYVDFGDLAPIMNSDNMTEVNIESYLLKMVSNMTAKDDPELSSLLQGLKLVKVYSFKVDGKSAREISGKIDQIDNKLSNKDWNRIVKVKSKGENTNVYIKTTPDQKHIVGLVVTSLEKDGEAAFVNIVGKIDMDALGRLGNKFDIPSLEKIHK